MEQYILAIDQGTTSTRALLFDKDQHVVQMAQREIKQFYPHPGWVLEDANEIWLSTLVVMADVLQAAQIQPSQIKSIGITNQRETTVIWDKETGLPVSKAIVWQSRQTNDIVDRYRKLGYEPIIREKTGLVLDPYFSATKIRWILEEVPGVKDNPNLLFGTIDTWLVWKLSGGKAHVTDVTNASRTMLFNIHTLDWDDELLEIFDIPRSILPQVVDTAGPIAEVTPHHFFNYEGGCPINAICGDQQAALFGQSCLQKGDVKNTYGTGGFLLMNTGDNIVKSEHGLLSTVAWRINGQVQYALEGSIFVSGSLIQWLRDGLGIIKNASETEEIARSVESSEGVIIVPAFTGIGAPYWNKNCKGSIFGLTRGCDYRHLVRASLEAMAYQSKDLLNVMEQDSAIKINSLKVDGGASSNNFLLEFQSDILGIPVIRGVLNETTALGAARLAGLACGFYNEDAFKVGESKVFEPSISKEEADALYAKWEHAVDSCISF